jgi:hypothetical protein
MKPATFLSAASVWVGLTMSEASDILLSFYFSGFEGQTFQRLAFTFSGG